ncbi:MAG: hypothetical protein NCA08_07390 [Deltaproteobacteria bacterium]|nr:hypothetical protein [Candidatus Deferrimicrobium borealis]
MTGEKSVAACTFCGQPITGESPEQHNPCDYCSSLSGGYPHLVNLTEAIAGAAVGYRDDIIRKGLIVGRTDAEESIRTASDFLAHLTEQCYPNFRHRV